PWGGPREAMRGTGVVEEHFLNTNGVSPQVPETGPMPREKGKPAADKAKLPFLIPPIGGPAGAASMEVYQWLLLQDPQDADLKRLRELLKQVPPLDFKRGPMPGEVGPHPTRRKGRRRAT